MAREAAYRGEHLPEYRRLIGLAFFWAVVFNVLFLFSDWRLVGQPHFPATVSARCVLLAVTLACLALVRRVRDFGQVQGLCLAWSAPVIVASAVLVSRATDVALFVVFILPVIFYLVLPLTFGWLVLTGGSCGLLALGAYLLQVPDSGTRPGLVVAMSMLNVVLALVVSRSNRLQRLAWAAAKAEQGANRDLSEHRRILETLLRAVPTPLVIMVRKTGRVIEANDAARRYFGEETLGDPTALLQTLGRKELARLAADWPAEGRTTQIETVLRLADGRQRNVLLALAVATVRGEEAILASVVDITDRKAMEAHLEELASTDSLTRLRNRARFFALADEEIQRAQRYGRPLSVIMFDIDFFKRINDTCGHEAGGTALRALGGLCRQLVRQSDLAGRIGGEEFALLLPETAGPGALLLAERLREGVAALRCPGVTQPLTISVGVAGVLPTETRIDPALSRADQALYAAKRGGRNRVECYREDMEPTGAARQVRLS